jgi:hypothetical protein
MWGGGLKSGMGRGRGHCAVENQHWQKIMPTQGGAENLNVAQVTEGRTRGCFEKRKPFFVFVVGGADMARVRRQLSAKSLTAQLCCRVRMIRSPKPEFRRVSEHYTKRREFRRAGFRKRNHNFPANRKNKNNLPRLQILLAKITPAPRRSWKCTRLYKARLSKHLFELYSQKKYFRVHRGCH